MINLPRNQCIHCGAWVDDEARVNHICPKIDDLIYRITNEKAKEQSEWIDSTVKSLLSKFQVFIIESSKTPNLIKKVVAKSAGIEIIHQQLIGNFGWEVIIKKNGEVKARRKFNI